MATASESTAAVTLALRGECIPLRSAVSSIYNPVKQHLLVASPPVLYLYGKLIETGGEVIATLSAEPNVHFQFVLYIAWLDVYSVIAIQSSGRVQHCIVSTDLKTSTVTHVITDRGTFFTAVANTHRRELVTADSDGGIKVWALRASTSSAAAAGGLKGILRVHTATAATRKPMYQQLCLAAASGQRLLARTGRKIHVLDPATCTLQLSCALSQTAAIERIVYSTVDDAVYAVFHNNKRSICKFYFVQKRAGDVVLKRASEQTACNDSVAFCCADTGTAGSADSLEASPLRADTPGPDADETIHGLFVLDDCGLLTITSFGRKRQQQQRNAATVCDAGGSDGSFPHLSLHMNPAGEPYVALHSELRLQHRNFVFVVCSSGLCIVEAFLPHSTTRLVVTTTRGDAMKCLERRQAADNMQVAVYQPAPTPRIMLLGSSNHDFHYVQLRVPGVLDTLSSATAAPPSSGSSVRLVDVAAVDARLVVLWSNGVAQTYVPSDSRMRVVLQLEQLEQQQQQPPMRATSIAVLRLHHEVFVAVGDARGGISIVNVTFETSRACGRRDAHHERVAALSAISKSMTTTIRTNALLLVSVSRAGEVKLWLLAPAASDKSTSEGSTAALHWELHACFRTSSVDVSAVCLLQPEFLFCGFDSGSVECWRLPSVSTGVAPGQQQQSQLSTARIAVVRRPLHALDIHLTPVRHLECEQTSSSSVSTRQVPDDAFSWIASVDDDGVVLVWCFSLELFFPHRRIRVHDRVRGLFFTHSAHPASVQLFAYVGKCVELLDELAQGDRDIVSDRVQRGKAALREQAAARAVRPSESPAVVLTTTTMPASQRLNAHADTTTSAPTAAPVHIHITLPGVGMTNTMRRHDTRSPTRQPASSQVTCVDVGLLLEHDGGSSVDDAPAHTMPSTEQPLATSHSSSPTALAQHTTPTHVLVAPLLHTPEITAEQAFVPKLEKTAQRATKKTKNATSTLVPTLSSVPSTFSKAKPRVYNTRFTPADAAKKQTQCNVVTTGGASATEAGGNANNYSAMYNSRAYSEYEPQEKVAVVSLADLDDDSVLMLDFHASTRRRRQLVDNAAGSAAQGSASIHVRFIAWSGLTDTQRRVELMAATKSRSVQADAARDEVAIPSLEAFSSTDVKVQLAVHAFTKWFSSTQQQQQQQWTTRARFLLEELAFAGADAITHSEMTQQGLSLPTPECIGDLNTAEWYDFAAWYASALDGTTASKLRLEARSRYLQHRLEVVRAVEIKLRGRQTVAGSSGADVDRVFVFEDYRWPPTTALDEAMSWDNASAASRESEVAIALLDPDVQVAAMRSEIELPDLSGVCLDDLDLLALAGKFVPWWSATGNATRLALLHREVDEAFTDATIHAMLTQEARGDTNEDDDCDDAGSESGSMSFETFSIAYFKSEHARLAFLKRKLFYLKRKSRISSVAKYGKPPAPVVFETLPKLLCVVFVFPTLVALEDIAVDEVEDTALPEQVDPETDDGDSDDTTAADAAREEAMKAAAALAAAVAQAAFENDCMMREDELSRELQAQVAEADDDDDSDSKVFTPPKRSDFSRSYFYGDLPDHFHLPSSGWDAGSGLDNGDEELDAQEQLEREQERQRLLDLQEAERLAEEERRAEQARLDREADELAWQQRRVRQFELRKVLIYQSELEARRRDEREQQRVADELKRMESEEAHERMRLARLAAEYAAMQCEDDLARQVRSQMHDVAIATTRRQLSEQALMGEEDVYSATVEREQALRDRDAHERRLYLAELYTPFEPFFLSSREPTEDFLPSIERRRIEHEHKRHARRHHTPATTLSTSSYALPFAETLVLDDVERDPYVARDSRKFNVLMGLRVRKPQPAGQRRQRAYATSERRDMIRSLDGDDSDSDFDERATMSTTTSLAQLPPPPQSRLSTTASLPALMLQRQQQQQQQQKSRRVHLEKPQLPGVGASKALACTTRSTKQTKQATNKTHNNNNTNNSSAENNQRPLPFFRGNLLVRGEAKTQSLPARAKDDDDSSAS